MGIVACLSSLVPGAPENEKMEAENNSQCGDENAALVEKDSGEDAPERRDAVAKANEPKLTLYHWTQSFNSQKVSVPLFQHQTSTDSSRLKRNWRRPCGVDGHLRDVTRYLALVFCH